MSSSTGALVPGRCRATNLCPYCQRLYVIETVEMLTLDAMEHAPTAWIVLTARNHLTRAELTDHLRKLRKALRKRWPRIEWMVQVEFQRRGALHANLLVKGVPAEEADELRTRAVYAWCSRPGVDARPEGQWCEALEDGVAALLYVSKMLAHGLKAEQAPPLGWKGHRTSQTRGYLVRPAAVMRREARESLRAKRELHKALGEGLVGEAAEERAAARIEQARRTEWELVQLVPKLTGEVMLRTLRNGEPRSFMRRCRPPEAAVTDLDVLARWRAGLVGVAVDTATGVDSWGTHTREPLAPTRVDQTGGGNPGHFLTLWALLE